MKKTRQQNTDRKRLDIRDVARHAGVSIATVSRTINAVPTVDRELAARVQRSIRELNYFPNTQARSLVSGRSRLLGLLISEITNPFFPELIQGFEDSAVEHNYELLIGSTNYDPRRMEACIRRMVERNVEGVAVMTFGIEGPLLDELVARNIPMVFVDMPVNGLRAEALLVDYDTGILQAIEHLCELGHREIAFITGPMMQRSCQLRQEAYLKAMGACGLPVRKRLMLEGDHTLAVGTQAAERLLGMEPRPTAVLCSNDMMAIGVLRRLAAEGLQVPGDISVVGFDDIQLASYVYPSLTSVRMARSDLARGAFSVLRGYIEQPEVAVRQEVRIPTRLVVRESSGRVAGKPAKKGVRNNSV
jgi:DNA-binding LacI/PurR family transcriptional regulator